MHQQKLKYGLAFFIALTVLIFIIDIPTPQGIGIYFLYIFPILGIARQGKKNEVIIIAFLSTIFLIIGHFLSPQGIKPEYFVLLNRAFGIILIWIFTYVIIKNNESENNSKRKEQILNLILDNVSEGIIVTDAPDGRIAAISRWGINHTLGKSIDAVIDLPVERYLEQWDVRNPVTGEKIQPDCFPVARALKGEVILNEEWLMVRPDGTSFITSVNAVPIYNHENSAIINAVATWEDITEQKKAEIDLLKEKKYADELADFNMEILETSPYGIATYEAEGNCTYANEALCRIIGASRTQALAQNFHQIKSWKESGLYDLAMEALDKGVLQTKKVLHLTSFGNVLEAECKFMPFKVYEKVNLLFMINDITEYKKIERELNKNRKQLKNVIDYALDGIIVIDENQQIIIFNGACEKIFLADAKEAIGQSIERFIPNRYLEQHKQNILSFGKDNKLNKMMGEYGFVTGIRSTGEEFPMEASVSQYEIDGRKYYTVIHRDISERQKAEEALHESEERFRSLIVASSQVLYRMNADWSEMLQLNSTGFLANTEKPDSNWLQKYIQPDDQQYVKSVINGAISNKTIFEMEHRVIKADGNLGWTASRAIPIFNTNGEIKEWFGTAIDITSRKLAEEKIIKAKEQYDLLFNSISEGFAHYKAIYNETGKLNDLLVLEINSAGAEFSGVKREDQIGKTWKQVWAGIEDSLFDIYREVDKTGNQFTFEHSSGITNKWYIVNLYKILQDQFAVTFFDITDRKKAEEILQNSEIQLLDAQKLAHVGSFIYDLQSGVIEWTPETFNIYELDPNEKLPSIEIIQDYFHPDDKEKAINEISIGMQNNNIINFECRLLMRDFKIKYINYIARPIYDSSGKPVKRIGALMDITDRKLVEEKIKELNKQLVLQNKETTIEKMKWQGIVEGMAEEVWACNTEGQMDLINLGEATLMGLKEFKGRSLKEVLDEVEILNLDGQMRKDEDSPLLRSLNGEVVRGEEIMKHKFTGVTRFRQFSSAPMHDKNGKITGSVAIIRDITEQIENKQKLEKLILLLQESEEKLLDAQKLAHVGSFAYDIQTGKIEWTPETYNIYELNPNNEPPSIEIIQSYFYPEDRDNVLQAINYGMENDSIINLECRLLLHNGKIKYVSYVGRPVYDSKGELIKRTGAISDITDRKLSQLKLEEMLKKLQESESRLLDAQKLALMGNYTIDVITGIAEWSDQMYNLWEVNRDAPIPKFDKLWDKIYPDDREHVKKNLLQDIKENAKVETEFRILLPGNRIKYLHVITRGYFDGLGNLVKRQGVEIDITERKLQQKKLEDILVELRNSEAKLLEAQHLAHIGNFETEVDSEKVKWSEEIFNIYEREKNLGEPSYEEAIGYLHPDDRNYILQEVQKSSESSEPFELDYRIITNNKTKYIHYIGKPVLDSAGKVIKRTGAIMDVTERKLAQIKMENTLNDLNRSNKELEQFAYTVSHDLQEPIRMMKSYSELLIKRYYEMLDENANDFLGFISSSATRMNLLVSDLLKYSRISTKAQPFEKVDCNDVLKQVLDDLRFSIQEVNAVIIHDELPVVNSDRTQIRQVFQNLIQNALKFKNDRNPEIEIKYKKKRNTWIFSVKDNGIGIEQQYLERIFEIFQRLHTKEEYPGTGIGLAIVKKIIERHGGNVWVESEPGKGSTFYFTLPVMIV